MPGQKALMGQDVHLDSDSRGPPPWRHADAGADPAIERWPPRYQQRVGPANS